MLGDRIADYYRVPLYIGLASVPVLALLSLYSEMSRGFGRAGMAYAPPLLIRPALFLVAAAENLCCLLDRRPADAHLFGHFRLCRRRCA